MSSIVHRNASITRFRLRITAPHPYKVRYTVQYKVRNGYAHAVMHFIRWRLRSYVVTHFIPHQLSSDYYFKIYNRLYVYLLYFMFNLVIRAVALHQIVQPTSVYDYVVHIARFTGQSLVLLNVAFLSFTTFFIIPILCSLYFLNA